MALTLRDVVESQTQLRASGARRDLAQKQDAAAASRERFSLDASDRQSALEARSRASAARAEAAKAENAKTERAKPPEKPAQTERPSSAKSEPEGASRPELSTKPSSARAAPSPPQSGKPQADGAKADAADPDASKAATGDAASVAAKGESEETAVAKTAVEPNVAIRQLAPAVVAPPPLPVSSTTLSGAVQGDAEAEAGTGAAEASTANAGPRSAHAGSSAGSPAATKPGFELALADVSAANSGGATALSTAETAATSGPAAATSSTASAEKAAAPAQAQTPNPASAPVPLGAVPMTIGLRALGASNRFEIRLDPKELGRIDVSIDIDKETGTVGARLVVDRPETLALLQRDASSLQQALSQTGLDASAGVSLSLRNDQGSEQRNGSEAGANAQARAAGSNDRDGRQTGTDQSSIDLVPLRALRGLGRVDIRI